MVPDLQLVFPDQREAASILGETPFCPSFFPCLENSWGLKRLNILDYTSNLSMGMESLADSRKQVLSTSFNSRSHVNRRPPQFSAPAAASGWSCRKFQADCSGVSQAGGHTARVSICAREHALQAPASGGNIKVKSNFPEKVCASKLKNKAEPDRNIEANSERIFLAGNHQYKNRGVLSSLSLGHIKAESS